MTQCWHAPTDSCSTGAGQVAYYHPSSFHSIISVHCTLLNSFSPGISSAAHQHHVEPCLDNDMTGIQFRVNPSAGPPKPPALSGTAAGPDRALGFQTLEPTAAHAALVGAEAQAASAPRLLVQVLSVAPLRLLADVHAAGGSRHIPITLDTHRWIAANLPGFTRLNKWHPGNWSRV